MPAQGSLSARIIQPARGAEVEVRLRVGAALSTEIEWQVPAKTVVRLRSRNGNIIVLEPNTVFRAAAVSDQGEVYSLCEGRGFFSVRNPLSFFNVVCKRFVALVRGTEFSVTAQPGASIQFDVTEGRVLVTRDVKFRLEGADATLDSVESELLAADCRRSTAAGACKSSARYPLNEDEFLPRRFSSYEDALQFFRAQAGEARAARNYSALQSGLFGAGIVLQRSSKLSQALAYYGEALQAAQAEHDRKREAWALNNIGLAEFDLGRYASAIDYQQQALALRQALYRGDHRELADSYNNLAIAHYALDHYCRALELHGKALAMRRVLYRGGAHNDSAQSLSNMGAVYFDLGRFAQAADYHEQALALRKELYRSGNHPDIASNRYNLGKAVQELGELARAESLFRDALGLARKLRIQRIEANAIDAVGTVLRLKGDASNALRYHEQALQLRRQLFGDRHPAVAASWSNLGEDHAALGQWREAQQRHEQALTLRLKLHALDSPAIAQSRANFGAALFAQGDARGATQQYRQAVESQRRIYPNAAHPRLAGNLWAFASVRRAVGDADGALELESEAKLVQRRLAAPLACPRNESAR